LTAPTPGTLKGGDTEDGGGVCDGGAVDGIKGVDIPPGQHALAHFAISAPMSIASARHFMEAPLKNDQRIGVR
jgi:hypothetical protein